MASGESRNGREIMRFLQGAMIESGVPKEKAARKAREVTIRGDRKMRGEKPLPIIGQGKRRK